MKRILLMMLLLGLVPILAVGQDAPPGEPPDSMTAPVLPAPATNLQAVDHPNDHGHGIDLSWTPSVDDQFNDNGTQVVTGYEVMRWEPYLADTVVMYRRYYSYMTRGEARHPGEVLRDTLAQLIELGKAGEMDIFPLLPPEVDVPAMPEEGDSISPAALLVASMEQQLAGMPEEFLISNDTLRTYRANIYKAIGRLPEAYGAYPNSGEWRLVAKSLLPDSYEHIGSKDRLSNTFFPDYTDYYYRIDATTDDPNVRVSSEVLGPVQCYGQWYNTGRTIVLVFVLAFTVLLLAFVSLARKGGKLYVRPLGGIEAVDEAIGRATEMGRPILYVLGLGTASDVATIASFSILGRVAKKVAEYQTPLLVPTYDPIVMTVAQEVVKSAYLDAGRPDDYKDDTVFFVTQSQFAYVAAVNGLMLRHLPATNVYMGKFYAESLLLAETGALAGSIQISGTDEIAQIPFFIVACDYTLIGEELYAASAYLSREPILLGSLKAQDYMKAAIIVFAILGLLAAQFDLQTFTQLFVVSN